MIFPMLRSSGFVSAHLLNPSSRLVVRGEYQAGLKFSIRDPDKRYPEVIKYCPSCIIHFTKEYGTAYLVVDWLGDTVSCSICNEKLVALSCVNRKSAVSALDRLFKGIVVH